MRAFRRDDEPRRGIIAILRAIGVEIVVEQDRDLARKHTGIGGLLRHDRLIGLQALKERYGGIKILIAAAKRQIDGHNTNLTHSGRGRIKIADHATIGWVEKIIPALRNGAIAQRPRIHKNAKRSGMDGEPIAFLILEPCGDTVKTGRLIWRQDPGFARLWANLATKIDNIGHGARAFSDQSRQGLAGVFIVRRDRQANLALQQTQHATPIRPFRRAIIADSACRLCSRRAECHAGGQTRHQKVTTFHKTISNLTHLSVRLACQIKPDEEALIPAIG